MQSFRKKHLKKNLSAAGFTDRQPTQTPITASTHMMLKANENNLKPI